MDIINSDWSLRAQIVICLQRGNTTKGLYLPMRKMLLMNHTVITVPCPQMLITLLNARDESATRGTLQRSSRKQALRQYHLEDDYMNAANAGICDALARYQLEQNVDATPLWGNRPLSVVLGKLSCAGSAASTFFSRFNNKITQLLRLLYLIV
ncbi:hypothetical protein MIR68_004196 [Amoeboaphelidium protococcarum]|nr:hypothetical protein MIR68_004196 [Amoeboaphelidium protococcarum]